MSRLAPQMEEYDAWGSRLVWKPYVMFFQPADLHTASCNTDSKGFRVSVDAKGTVARVDESEGHDCSLVFGNSVAFSVGARSDAATLSARLSHQTGDTWLNFAGRAFSSSQEFLTFVYHRHLVGRVKRVVLFSGSNDLYLYYSPKTFDESLGVFFFSRFFEERMRQPAELKWAQRVWKAAVPSRLARRRGRETDLDALIAERKPGREQAIGIVCRNLVYWKALTDGLGIELVYALQPIRSWVNKPVTDEEAELTREQRETPTEWNEILNKVMDQDHYHWFADRLGRHCADLSIRFIDMSREISAHSRRNEWLFIDHLHLTDAGYDVCADILASSFSRTAA